MMPKPSFKSIKKELAKQEGFTQEHKQRLVLKTKFEQETCDFILNNKLAFQIEVENFDDMLKNTKCFCVTSERNESSARQSIFQ